MRLNEPDLSAARRYYKELKERLDDAHRENTRACERNLNYLSSLCSGKILAYNWAADMMVDLFGPGIDE